MTSDRVTSDQEEIGIVLEAKGGHANYQKIFLSFSNNIVLMGGVKLIRMCFCIEPNAVY